ncbi:acyl-CoA dehydrogenase [Prauserella sp. PE36]|uniref:phosphotransferase family protein n=1 Tax=Prauserella sp. PE36 TaxID=1504709 RepID=UPI000DE365CC|nr:phosphotransferase family protein [Prauserella sp. PE36]RBM21803.1 acyl-CoA dehydrogenase [Prauserella sp. PE36]
MSGDNVEVVGLPRGRLDRWLASTLGDRFEFGHWRAEVISGGLSNLTYRLTFGDQSVILRRPPLGGVLPSAHDMRREWRLLTALHPTSVPVPEPLALCTDDSVIGVTFYVMSDVHGVVLRSAEDTRGLEVHQRTKLSETFVSTLTRLHAITPDEVGLGDFGRGKQFNERQVRRWGRQWDRVRQRQVDDMHRLMDELTERIPPVNDISIVHGDYRLDNMIVGLQGGDPRVEAVIDWEMSTLGDPLGDLGLALTYWHDLDDQERALIPAAAGVTARPGFLTAAEVADRYAALSGRDLHHLNFYLGMGAMKLAVILEGVGARFRAGHMAKRDELGLDDAVRALVGRGLRQLKSK